MSGGEKISLLTANKEPETRQVGFAQYSRRWFQLMIIVSLQVTNASFWISYSPVASSTAEYYDTSLTAVNLLSVVFMVAYVLTALPTTWMLHHKGIRWTVLVAAWLNGIGGIVRYLSIFPDGKLGKLFVLFIGQSICAVAQTPILGVPSLFANTWFSVEQRASANTIASIANPIGIAIASVLAPALVSSEKDIPKLQLVFAVPGVLIMILAFLFFEEKPPTPPSASAAEENEPFMPALKKMIRNVPFILLTYTFGIGAGCFNAIATLCAQIVNAEGYSDDDAGWFAAYMIGCGLAGAGAAGVFIDKTKMFSEALKGDILFATLSGLMFIFVLRPHQYALISVSLSLLGFFAFAALPIALELAVECTFPIHPGTAGVVMWLVCQAASVTIIFAMDALKGKPVYYFANGTLANATDYQHRISDSQVHEYFSMRDSVWFMFGIMGSAVLACFFIRTRYKRLETERKSQVVVVSTNRRQSISSVTLTHSPV